MKARRIGVVMGGTSAEREVSLRTGRAVADALASAGRSVVEIVLDGGVDTVEALRAARVDVAFLALHGRLGEDGCIQGLLEVLGVPYTGSDVLASALCMDKAKSKELFRLHNVPTPPYYVFNAEGCADVEEVHGSFGFPVVVKPRREGSSFGIAKVDNLPALARAIEDAQNYDRSVLGGALRRGQGDLRGHPGRSGARRHRDRAQDGHVRLPREVHRRRHRVLHAGASAAHAVSWGA